MKVNFKELKIYVDITKKDYVFIDAKLQVANMLYTNTNGIESHALAFKIFNAEDSVELTESEFNILDSNIKQFTRPSFIDGFNEMVEQLNKEDK